MQRREFLKGAAAGLGTVLAGPLAPVLLAQETVSGSAAGTARLENRHLRLDYDLATGRMNLRSPRGAVLLLRATAAVNLGRDTVLAADSRYVRRNTEGASTRPGLSGKQLIVSCKDSANLMDLELAITLLEDRPGAVVELAATNVSGSELGVPYVEPLRALLLEGAGCGFGNPRAESALTNGYLYYDAGQLFNSFAYTHNDFTSWWNTAFYLPRDRQTLVAGYLENRETEGQIISGWDFARGGPAAGSAMDLTARSLLHPRFVLKPGATVRSGPVLLLRGNDPFALLENYADTVGRLHQVKLNPIINGWCSWFYTHQKTSEEEQLKNAEFIAKHLKPYGMEWVQVDDGYQRCHGDWEGNERFPHGMKWLAQEIRKLGLKPGIWLAPFFVHKSTGLPAKHPDWFVRNADGSPSNAADCTLDITHPQARQWLFDLFKTVTEDWGYDFIKLDFVERSILGAPRYYDPSLSRAAVYRLGIETIRKAIGPNRHLLDCGPANETVGLCDSVRIELDLPEPTWEQYVKNFNSTAPSMAHRYYFHNRLWINDADHLCLKLLTIPQGQSAATLIGLSGGTTISGDPLIELNDARLDILKKTLPAYGQAARPIDLFENPHPELFSLPVQKGSQHWHLLGYFNYDETATKQCDLPLSRLGLDPQKPYLAYEFWTQHLIGKVTGTLHLRFEPAQVNLVALREATGVPQVLGTDRHYTQGALELDKVRWDPATQTLAGTALGAPGMQWSLAVYVPDGFSLAPSSELREKAYAIVAEGDNVLRVRFVFRDVSRVDWSLPFKQG